MLLFSMSEADVEVAVEAHSSRLYDICFGTDSPDPCCELCRHYYGGTCDIAEHPFSAEEIEAMTNEEYLELVEKDPDDCCDDFTIKEDEDWR